MRGRPHRDDPAGARHPAGVRLEMHDGRPAVDAWIVPPPEPRRYPATRANIPGGIRVSPVCDVPMSGTNDIGYAISGGWSNGKTPGLQPGDRGSIPRPVHFLTTEWVDSVPVLKRTIIPRF